MKRLFTLAFLSVFTVISAFAFTADIQIQWTPNPASDGVTNYFIYQAKAPATNYTKVVTVGNTNSAKVRVTSPGSYSFVVTAANTNAEGPKSLPVTGNIVNTLPSAPTNVTILNVTITGQ